MNQQHKGSVKMYLEWRTHIEKEINKILDEITAFNKQGKCIAALVDRLSCLLDFLDNYYLSELC